MTVAFRDGRKCAVLRMTDFDTPPHSRGAIRPRLANSFAQKKRAQGMPGARCTRGLVRKRWKEAHTSIQVQRKQSDIPCAMVLRLIPCSPRRRIRLVTVADGLAADRKPGRVRKTSASLTPATGARTTRLYRTQPHRSSCALHDRSRKPPCDRNRARRCRVHRIPSQRS